MAISRMCKKDDCVRYGDCLLIVEEKYCVPLNYRYYHTVCDPTNCSLPFLAPTLEEDEIRRLKNDKIRTMRFNQQKDLCKKSA